MLFMNVEIGLPGMFRTMTTIMEQKINYFTLEVESFIELDRVLNGFGCQRISKYIRNYAFKKWSIGHNPDDHQIMNGSVKYGISSLQNIMYA